MGTHLLIPYGRTMETQVLAYILFGVALTVLFGIIIMHYYARKRHDRVEEAKYKMLDDDE